MNISRIIATICIAIILVFAFNSLSLSEVIISEIMYNPSGDENSTEYIELYNRGDVTVNLRNWQISDGQSNDSLTVLEFAASMRLDPGHYAIILDADYETEGEDWYEDVIPEDVLRLTITGSTIGSRGLSNSSSEAVALINQIGEIVSTRSYIPNAPQGVSEERRFMELGEDNSNWAFSSEGGTPGYKNSITPPDFDLAIDSIIVKVDTLENGNSLHFLTWLSNKGKFVFPADTVTFYINDPLLNQLSQISSKYLVDVDSANIWSVEDSIFDLPGGNFEIIATLLDGGENNTNDSLLQSALIPFEPGAIQISEIMPDPPDSIDVEWLEIKNQIDRPVNLLNWHLLDVSQRHAFVTDTTAFIESDDYYVLAQNSVISTWPGLWPDQYSVTSGWAPLNNSGDTLKLIDPTGRVIDHIAYIDPPSGLSLNRDIYSISPNTDFWIPSTTELIATPGDSNNVVTPPDTTEPFILPEFVRITVDPDPFSPNNDGYQDYSTFSFEFPAEQVELSICLYDVNGRKLGTILPNQTFTGRSNWQWDGKSGVSHQLTTGIYIWLMEVHAISSENGHWKKKGTIVIVD